jgi:hypothetical protein
MIFDFNFLVWLIIYFGINTSQSKIVNHPYFKFSRYRWFFLFAHIGGLFSDQRFLIFEGVRQFCTSPPAPFTSLKGPSRADPQGLPAGKGRGQRVSEMALK